MEWARDTARQMPWVLKSARNYALMDRSQTPFVGKEVSESTKPFEFELIIDGGKQTKNVIFLAATAVRDVSNRTGTEPHGHTIRFGFIERLFSTRTNIFGEHGRLRDRATFFILLRGHCWGFLNAHAVTFVSESLYIMFEACGIGM